MAKVGVTSFGAHLGALHIVRCVRLLDEEILRDRLAKRGHADLTVEFVERSEKWFAGNDIDVNARAIRTTKYSSAFNRRFKTVSLGTGRFGSKPVVSFFSFCVRKKT